MQKEPSDVNHQSGPYDLHGTHGHTEHLKIPKDYPQTTVLSAPITKTGSNQSSLNGPTHCELPTWALHSSYK